MLHVVAEFIVSNELMHFNLQLHLVLGFNSGFDTYVSLLLPAPLSHSVHLSQFQFSKLMS